MDALRAYNDDSDSDNRAEQAPATLLSCSGIVAAPGNHVREGDASVLVPSNTSTTLVAYNSDSAKADIMWAPSYGPSNVGGVRKIPSAGEGTIAGRTQADSLDVTVFERQYRQYTTVGYVADPRGTGAIIGDVARIAAVGTKRNLAAIQDSTSTINTGKVEIVGAVKRARLEAGKASDVDSWQGPWAGYAGEADTKKSALQSGTMNDLQKKIRAAQGYHPDRPGKVGEEAGAAPIVAAEPAAADTEAVPAESTASADTTKKKHGNKSAIIEASPREFDWGEEVVPANTGAGVKAAEATSTFHGKSEYDYQGRSWMETPKGVRPDGGDHECFLPKKKIHTYTGHTKGVQSIELFPATGHLLLSGSMDSKVKIWDVNRDWNVKRTYLGHTAAVREIKFNNDGHRFSSVSYDRHVKIWDTESGSCLLDLTNGKVPYTLSWYPVDNNIVLVGMANRKILQYDIRTGEVVLEYDYHLGPVNAIVFYDENRRIMSTSDDKRVLFWDFNTPVPIKTMQDPSMHAITSAVHHPKEDSIAAQSMDNHVVVYHAGERAGFNRRKRFGGHVVAGYACQVSFSPNGQYLASGDGDGNAWFWDWKTTKLLKKMKCHDGGPCAGVVWHPLEPSWVFTCGWDNQIKVWD